MKAPKLTEREKQVVARLLQGEKRACIASELSIHIATVDFHLRNIRRKTRISSVLGVAIFFARLTKGSVS